MSNFLNLPLIRRQFQAGCAPTIALLSVMDVTLVFKLILNRAMPEQSNDI